MKFVEAALLVFINEIGKYTNLKGMFTGTMGREDYWMFQLVYVVVVLSILCLAKLVGVWWLAYVFIVPLWIPHIATQVKRSRDIGFWAGLPIVQVFVVSGIPVGYMIMLGVHCLPSKSGVKDAE